MVSSIFDENVSTKHSTCFCIIETEFDKGSADEII
jgi:hypothetical protein